MGDSAQDFWLAHLNRATGFNGWVFEGIRPFLGRRVLEVGCGIGNFTTLMAAAGHAITAVDINPDYVAIARDRLKAYPAVSVHCSDVTQAHWPEPFDTVVMLDVLEHIADDVALLRNLGQCLIPGGTLVLKVPAGQWLYGPMDRAIGHYRRYTRRSLAEALSAGGFTGIRQKHFNAVGILGWWVNGRLLGRVTPPAEQLGLFERLLPVVQMADRFNPFPFGLSLIAAGTKIR